MKRCDKLVRDKIPNIIERSGREAVHRIVEDDEEYFNLLKEKLIEEVQEFVTDPCVEELADIYEVITAILAHKNVKLREMFEIAIRKRKYSGGFSRRVFLEYCEEVGSIARRNKSSK